MLNTLAPRDGGGSDGSVSRHEQMTVAMVLAGATPHAAPLGPKTARAGEVEGHVTDEAQRSQKEPPRGAAEE